MKPKLKSAYLSVEDMTRAVAFYQWFLGREVSQQLECLYLFDIDGFRLFLFDHNKEKEPKVYGDNCLLSFEVEDARTLKTKLEQHGCLIVYPLTKILNNYVFEFADPEGNHVEVFSPVVSS